MQLSTKFCDFSPYDFCPLKKDIIIFDTCPSDFCPNGGASINDKCPPLGAKVYGAPAREPPKSLLFRGPKFCRSEVLLSKHSKTTGNFCK